MLIELITSFRTPGGSQIFQSCKFWNSKCAIIMKKDATLPDESQVVLLFDKYNTQSASIYVLMSQGGGHTSISLTGMLVLEQISTTQKKIE